MILCDVYYILHDILRNVGDTHGEYWKMLYFIKYWLLKDVIFDKIQVSHTWWILNEVFLKSFCTKHLHCEHWRNRTLQNHSDLIYNGCRKEVKFWTNYYWYFLILSAKSKFYLNFSCRNYIICILDFISLSICWKMLYLLESQTIFKMSIEVINFVFCMKS